MNFANLFRNEENPLVCGDDERVIGQGDLDSEQMYVVLEGEAEILLGDDMVLETVSVGGVFGEMSIIEKEPAAASVVAKSQLKLAVIDERRFLFLIQEHPNFALELMRVMSRRLRRMDRRPC